MSDKTHMTYEEWHAEGERRFSPDLMIWRFVCPLCDRVASMQEWNDAGLDEGHVAFSCVSRADKKTDCDYAGGGLNPVVISFHDRADRETFAFADASEGGAV